MDGLPAVGLTQLLYEDPQKVALASTSWSREEERDTLPGEREREALLCGEHSLSERNLRREPHMRLRHAVNDLQKRKNSTATRAPHMK